MNALVAGVLLLWATGFLFLFRLPRCRRQPGCDSDLALSVIIPARNEEQALPRLLRSLAAQELQPAEVLVVDDASTDGTARVARAAGATVISPPPLPPGWRGKAWACQHGAAAARGRTLLFLDADVWLEPGALRVLCETYAAQPGVLTVAPYHCLVRPYERLSAFFNLLMVAGSGAFTLLGTRLAPRGLFGQFLLVDRQAYQAAGGHAAVQGCTLENFALAPAFRRARVPLRSRVGRGVVTMRMYPNGLRDLIAGWIKAAAVGAAGTAPLLLALTVVWLTGAILAAGLLAWSLATGAASALGLAAYALYVAQLHYLLARLGSFGFATALLYPVPLAFYLAVFAAALWRGARGRTVLWKGRPVAPTGRDRPC